MKRFIIQAVLGAMALAAGSIWADVITIKSADQFNSAVLNASKPAVVKVGATWCPACVRAIQPFHKLAQEYPDVVFADIDVDANEGLANKYNVESYPTFLFFDKNGQKVQAVKGFKDTEVKNIIEQKLRAGAPAGMAADKKKEERATPIAEQLEKSEVEGGASCAVTQQEGFFQRAYNATRDFFLSLRDKVSSWFK